MLLSHQFFQNSALSPLVSLVAPVPVCSMFVGGQVFSGLAASTSRAPWGLVAGRRVLPFLRWPCGRQLVDGLTT